MQTISKRHRPFEIVLIYQPPNAHLENFAGNAMAAAAAVTMIYL
jgi:hypothetical protein